MNQLFGRTLTGAMLCFTVVHCQPCWADPDNPFESKLAELATRSAKQCGLVRLHHNSAEGWQCAVSAERGKEPFWFAFQQQGDDSQVWMAAIRTPSGTHIILSYDSYPKDVGLRFVQTRCPGSIDFQPNVFPPFKCRGT